MALVCHPNNPVLFLASGYVDSLCEHHWTNDQGPDLGCLFYSCDSNLIDSRIFLFLETTSRLPEMLVLRYDGIRIHAITLFFHHLLRKNKLDSGILLYSITVVMRGNSPRPRNRYLRYRDLQLFAGQVH